MCADGHTGEVTRIDTYYVCVVKASKTSPGLLMVPYGMAGAYEPHFMVQGDLPKRVLKGIQYVIGT